MSNCPLHWCKRGHSNLSPGQVFIWKNKKIFNLICLKQKAMLNLDKLMNHPLKFLNTIIISCICLMVVKFGMETLAPPSYKISTILAFHSIIMKYTVFLTPLFSSLTIKIGWNLVILSLQWKDCHVKEFLLVYHLETKQKILTKMHLLQSLTENVFKSYL